jgi:hypothetical protein
MEIRDGEIVLNLDEPVTCENCDTTVPARQAYIDFAVTSDGDQEPGWDRTISFGPTIVCRECAIQVPCEPAPFPIGGAAW